MAKKKAAKPKTAKKAVKAAKATSKATAKKPAAKKADSAKAKPLTLSKDPAATTAKKATAKKARKGRVKSVATLKRAGLLRGKSSKRNTPSSAPEKLVEAQLEKLALKWEALFAKAAQIPSESYSMRKTFESQTGLKHKTLGWGFIIDNKNDRLEVLFKDGIRYLISNYK